MSVQYFLYIFLFIIYLFLPLCYTGTEPPLTSGPFKSSIVSIKDCSNPGKPYLKDPPMLFHPEIQNVDGKNILHGNLTVLKDTKDVRMKLKSYSWRNGKWCQSHSFTNLDCHGALLHFTFAATNIKYDRKNCMFFKGFYSFKVDVNQIQHIWVPTVPYGRQLWRSETYSKGAMFICKEYDTITEPAING